MKKIAEFLKNYRINKGIDEATILKNTTLTPHVIRLIEEGDFKSIGASFYVKNFLTQYCKVIGLEENETEDLINKIVAFVEQDENVKVKLNENEDKIGVRFFIMAGVILFIIAGFWFFSGTNSPKDVKTQFANTEKAVVVNNVLTANNKEVKKNSLSGKMENQPEKQIEFSKENDVETKNKLMESNKEKFKDKTLNDVKTGKMPINSIEQKPEQKVELEKKDFYSNQKEKIKVDFIANCMCWVNITFENRVIKDFILKENEKFSIDVPKGAKISLGNAVCLKLFFNKKPVDLPEVKVIKDITVE